MHITNRYAEETGTKTRKYVNQHQQVRSSFIVTTSSDSLLTFTPMKPIETVGIALSGGIVITTFYNDDGSKITLLLDLRKPKHPPLPVFEVVQAIKWSKGVIAVFMS